MLPSDVVSFEQLDLVALSIINILKSVVSYSRSFLAHKIKQYYSFAYNLLENI